MHVIMHVFNTQSAPDSDEHERAGELQLTNSVRAEQLLWRYCSYDRKAP